MPETLSLVQHEVLSTSAECESVNGLTIRQVENDIMVAEPKLGLKLQSVAFKPGENCIQRPSCIEHKQCLEGC